VTETLRRNDARQRYELDEDGEVVGIITFTENGDTITLVHTEVEDAERRHGYASRLVKFALDDIGAHGQRVVPRCPFVKHYIETHPEYADLEA